MVTNEQVLKLKEVLSVVKSKAYGRRRPSPYPRMYGSFRGVLRGVESPPTASADDVQAASSDMQTTDAQHSTPNALFKHGTPICSLYMFFKNKGVFEAFKHFVVLFCAYCVFVYCILYMHMHMFCCVAECCKSYKTLCALLYIYYIFCFR